MPHQRPVLEVFTIDVFDPVRLSTFCRLFWAHR